MASLAKGGSLALFIDFDGTLVELAETPDTISFPTDLTQKLARLSARLDGRLAVVSGRSIEDLEAHLGSLPLAVAGSHGVARRLADGSILGDAPKGIDESARTALRNFASEHALNLEEKTHGIALHFRSNPDKQSVAHEFAQGIAEQHELALKEGKCVVELVEQGADKGSAVRAFMETPPFLGQVPWFIGDDVTDEDGFAACRDMGGGGILVGERVGSCANYALSSVDAVHQWLEL